MQYRVIENHKARDLEKAVNKAIVDGWTPLGGVSVSLIVPNSERTYTQAMTTNNMSIVCS